MQTTPTAIQVYRFIVDLHFKESGAIGNSVYSFGGGGLRTTLNSVGEDTSSPTIRSLDLST
jgi:hypothetical protein